MLCSKWWLVLWYSLNIWLFISNITPLFFRNTTSHEVASQLAFSQADLHQIRSSEGAVSKKVTFGDLVRSSELDELENRGQHNDREQSTIWNSNAAATTTMDDPNSSFSPYLPPVLEEPSSSFSEGLNLLNIVPFCFELGLVIKKIKCNQ